jgi:hypothetical protein
MLFKRDGSHTQGIVRRSVLTLGAVAGLLAACGDDSASGAASSVPSAVAVDTTTVVTAAPATTRPPTTKAPTTTAAQGPISPQPSVEQNAPYLSNGQVVDVAAWRDELVRIALANSEGKGGGRLPPQTAAWVTAYPTVLAGGRNLVGFSLEAPENGISGFGVVDLKAPGRNAVLMFAAKAADGSCAGAVISGDAKPTNPLPVELAAGQPCTAVQVLENSGIED